jgi:trans-aconitate methyltransferase
MSSSPQQWDPVSYSCHARFVSELGAGVLELLAPRPGERILDLGCGDGMLTAQLAAAGCRVVGVDASAAQVDGARKLGLDVRIMSGESLQFESEFDAVFSNAALHWMKRADDVIRGVRRALLPGGRFVAEMGGERCVEKIKQSLVAALERRSINGREAVPWYFPSAEEYRGRLESQGFRVDSMVLFDRPTPLPGDITGWLDTFAEAFTSRLPAHERAAYVEEVRRDLDPQLRDAQGTWIADYVRLRFAATKLGDSR